MQKPKMSRKISSVCVALLLTLTSAQAAQKTLNSISEIKCYVPQPTNILELLHWFANTVNIDNHGNVRLTFEPESQYGSHHYGNFEGMLNRPPWLYKYYTVGNIHQDLSSQLPRYVRNAGNGTNGWNRGRIIFSATQTNGRWNVQQIYITQHRGTSGNNDTSYDPNHTYQITTNLLRELRGRSISEIQQDAIDSQRSNFANTFSFQQQSYSNRHYYYNPQSSPRSDEGNLLNVCIVVVVLCIFFFVIVALSMAGK